MDEKLYIYIEREKQSRHYSVSVLGKVVQQEKLAVYDKKNWPFDQWISVLVINSQLFLLFNFSKFLYIFTLFIHPSTLNITNKTPHSPDDCSAEPKRYSVDWLCVSINPHFLFGLLVVNFSLQITIHYFLPYIYIYIYIYIYEYISIYKSIIDNKHYLSILQHWILHLLNKWSSKNPKPIYIYIYIRLN